MGEVPFADIKERIMGELVLGKTRTNQLQAILRDPREARSVLVHDLVAKILGSFTESLSVLGSGSNKKRSGYSKEKRGCYKRRNSSQTRTRVSSTIEDDHTWRKYGQKEIQDSKYPRSYFRCTHKHDQNCKAVRQVQMIEENPLMYEITYIGDHTCMDRRKAPPPQMNKDSASLWDIHSRDIKDDLLFNCESSTTGATLVMKEDAKSEVTDIEIDSLFIGADDFPESNSKYQGYGIDFLMEDESSNLSAFWH